MPEAEAFHPGFTLALALAAGVLAQSAARHLHIPGIVLLLAAGIGLGPDGLGWVQPTNLGAGLYTMVDIAVAVVLFEGGLNLQMSRLRREQAPIRRLVTLGALTTLLGGALAAHVLLEWDWNIAVLFGGLVVVTGPTVVGPLITELRLKQRIATILEAEGVLIDPIGAILAALLLDIVLAPNAGGLASGGAGLALRIAFGAVAGIAAGVLIARALRVRRLVPQGFENIFVLAMVILLFESCESVVSHSGILAVTSAGVAVGNLRTLVDRDLREFKDQLSMLLIGLLFIMLAANVRFEQVQALGWPGLVVVAALVLVVRPLGVFISTLGSEYSTRERLFIAWIAPRGIVAAAVASIVAAALEAQGMAGGTELRALVFLTIACTVTLAGVTGGPIASALGVRMPGRNGVAILSVNALGLALGDALRAEAKPVTFIDSNPQSCRVASDRGFNVVYGNAIQESVMQRARLDALETVIGMTSNKTLNGVFANRAREDFGVPVGLIAAAQVDGGLVSEMVERSEAHVVFEGLHDVQRWDVRFRRGDVQIVRRRFRERPPSEDQATATPNPGERFVILALHGSRGTRPMSMDQKPGRGDEATVAIHAPEREEALRILESMGWWEIPEMLAGEGEGEASTA